ncbi:MAG: hypothetical protein OEZ10_12160 [Gammaproteobacteria bacterium]|nr:hypothetical protein [Gammaproteobacteria bacterium]
MKIYLYAVALACAMPPVSAAVSGATPDVAPIMLAKGPPDHAPAHGVRNKKKAHKQEKREHRPKRAHRYQYYPDARVYFDPARSVYFYQKGGAWISAPRLPRELKVNLGSGVSMDLDVADPYKLHREHLKQFPTPPKIRLR